MSNETEEKEHVRVTVLRVSSVAELKDAEEANETLVDIQHKEDSTSETNRYPRRKVTREERNYIWHHSKRRCYICRTPLDRLSDWHVEHVLAFSANPEENDVLGNMLASCPTCNLKKGKRSLQDCVRIFAQDLDSTAAQASHLNTAARDSILRGLKVKRDIFVNGDMPIPAVLDCLEQQILSGNEKDAYTVVEHIMSKPLVLFIFKDARKVYTLILKKSQDRERLEKFILGVGSLIKILF
eukprot:m.109540 g.109540  ORF g.109540 m.109540 type:complete len:240 (+) comp14005_c0_seq3:300-1019(+)